MGALGREKSTIPLGIYSPIWQVTAYEVHDFIKRFFNLGCLGKTSRFDHLF